MYDSMRISKYTRKRRLFEGDCMGDKHWNYRMLLLRYIIYGQLYTEYIPHTVRHDLNTENSDSISVISASIGFGSPVASWTTHLSS